MVEIVRKHGVILLDDEDAWVLDEYWLAIDLSRRHRKIPYRQVRAVRRGQRKGPKLNLGRLLMNPPDGMEVDHINLDPLDNRRSNLRVVTRSMNVANRRMANSNWYKGIRQVPGGLGYHARIKVDGVTYSTTGRPSPELAALDFNRMVISTWGRDMHLNDVPCMAIDPAPAQSNCLFCNAPCYCCCVCSDPPSAGMQRLFDTYPEPLA